MWENGFILHWEQECRCYWQMEHNILWERKLAGNNVQRNFGLILKNELTSVESYGILQTLSLKDK